MGKYALAQLNFVQALRLCGDAVSDHRVDLLSNLGLSLLMLRQPQAALDCFRASARWASNSAALWVRMAECHILLHDQACRAQAGSGALYRSETKKYNKINKIIMGKKGRRK